MNKGVILVHYYKTAYPVFASTNGVALEIYLSGCKEPHCKGCHSPHTWDFNAGQDMNDPLVMKAIVDDISEKYQKEQLDNICILGGEPLDNPVDDLIAFLTVLQHLFPKCQYFLYTHYDEKEIWAHHTDILPYLNYIKVGAYDESQKPITPEPDPLTGVKLATKNQYFIRGNRFE